MRELEQDMSRRSKWFRSVAYAFLVISVLSVFYFWSMTLRFKSGWERHCKMLSDRGVPLFFAEIDQARPAIADDRNSAVVLTSLAPDIAAIRATIEGSNPGLYCFASEKPDVFRPLDADTLDRSRKFRDSHGELLAKLERLRDLPSGRWRSNWREIENHADGTDVPLGDIRAVAGLLDLDGSLRFLDGDVAGGVDRIQLLWSLADSLKDDPSSISFVVRMAVDVKALELLERGLRLGELSPADLASLDRGLVARLAEDRVESALMGERAFAVGVMQAMHEKRLAMDDASSLAATLGSTPVPEFLIRHSQLLACELLEPLMSARSDPILLMKRADELNQQSTKLNRFEFPAKLLVADLHRIFELHAKLLDSVNCARVILAAERHRLLNGRLPSGLDDLPRPFLDSLSIDYFDGKPLKFAATADGIVFYSVAENGVDDGGQVAVDETKANSGGTRRPLDWGFRLVRPELRQMTLVPPGSDDLAPPVSDDNDGGG